MKTLTTFILAVCLILCQSNFAQNDTYQDLARSLTRAVVTQNEPMYIGLLAPDTFFYSPLFYITDSSIISDYIDKYGLLDRRHVRSKIVRYLHHGFKENIEKIGGFRFPMVPKEDNKVEIIESENFVYTVHVPLIHPDYKHLYFNCTFFNGHWYLIDSEIEFLPAPRESYTLY